ncbi:MAG: serine/threonine protein kinase [Deltaproteobacteria bacterium]|nr:serine/threonine protein kinase [Deltaproteobacteria bacterium]
MAEFEPKQFGRFYLLEKLAVGGMAEIYKAKTFGAEGFEKLLAIKRILPHCSADKEFITMLIDEAKLSVLLSHANIVQVYDLGKVGDDYFISMEFINGVNLRDLLYRSRELRAKMPPETAVFVMSEICKGLDYAHRKADSHGHPLGIVHRDVSPQNVLLSYEGEVKLVDFGIAKAAMNISHTMAGILKGKIAYMSPEQALGKNVDYRTDIFSAGIILSECLTGEKLFTGESQFEVLKKIRTTKIDVGKLPTEIPRPLQQVLVKALAYFPKDRFQSCGEMQIELTKFLYATYHDFTPQKLAEYLRETFRDELERQQRQARIQRRMEAQTQSVPMGPPAIQQDIVVREASGASFHPSLKTRRAGPPNVPEDRTGATDRAHRRGLLPRMAVTVGIVCTLAVGVGAYFRWWHPRFAAHEEDGIASGSVNVNSAPTGARIFLDGADTGRTTPAMLDNLRLNQRYTLKLAKDRYLDLEQPLTLTSPIPLALVLTMAPAAAAGPTSVPGPAVSVPAIPPIAPPESKPEAPPETPSPPETPALKPPSAEAPPPDAKPVAPPPAPPPMAAPAANKGSIRVLSSPAGAAITLNGKPTGKTTPATIDGLPIDAKYTVSVSKREYDGWERSLTLTQPVAVTLSGALRPKKTPETVPTPAPVAATPPPTPVESALPSGGYGEVSVSSSPTGAMVYIDGLAADRAPVTIRKVRRDKTHQVRVVLKGYKPWERNFTLGADSEKRIHADMQKE